MAKSYKEIILAYASHEERCEMGTAIHMALTGNQDYIDSRIILNVEGASDGMYLCRLLEFADSTTELWLKIRVGENVILEIHTPDGSKSVSVGTPRLEVH